MTDNEILLSLSNMLEPIREEISDIHSELADIHGDISDLRSDVSDLQSDVSDIKGRVKKMELMQENVIIPRLDNIEACYVSTYERYKENVEEYDEMKQDVSILKKVVAEHSEILQISGLRKQWGLS